LTNASAANGTALGNVTLQPPAAGNLSSTPAAAAVNNTNGSASGEGIVASPPGAPPGGVSAGDGAASGEAFIACQAESYPIVVALDGQVLTNTFGPLPAAPPPPPAASNGTNATSLNGTAADAPPGAPPLAPPLAPPPGAPPLGPGEGNATDNATVLLLPPPLLPPAAPPADLACHFGECRDFLFYRDPVISHIFPNGGPSAGGSVLMVAGDFFDGMQLNASIARCAFGAVSVPVHAVPGSSALNCTTPAQPMSHVSFRLALNGFDFSVEKTTVYRYYPQRLHRIVMDDSSPL